MFAEKYNAYCIQFPIAFATIFLDKKANPDLKDALVPYKYKQRSELGNRVASNWICSLCLYCSIAPTGICRTHLHLLIRYSKLLVPVFGITWEFYWDCVVILLSNCNLSETELDCSKMG